MLAAYTLLSVYALWLFYLAVMALYSAKKKGTLTKPALVLGYPILIVGALLDFFVNAVLMTVLMLEPPREWLVTQRLSRHLKRGEGWRKAVASWVCRNLLDTFDPDHRGHCR